MLIKAHGTRRGYTNSSAATGAQRSKMDFNAIHPLPPHPRWYAICQLTVTYRWPVGQLTGSQEKTTLPRTLTSQGSLDSKIFSNLSLKISLKFDHRLTRSSYLHLIHESTIPIRSVLMLLKVLKESFSLQEEAVFRAKLRLMVSLLNITSNQESFVRMDGMIPLQILRF